MNLARTEAVALARGIAESVGDEPDVDVAVFPTFPWLVPVREALEGSSVILGAQDCYTADAGAYTGEVSPVALAEICNAVLAGHSERRHVLGESDDLIAAKVQAILRAGMRAYLCVGETLGEREGGRASAVVSRQLEAGLGSVSGDDLERLVIAYEPVWAIGTGVAASAGDAQEMCAEIRAWLRNRYGERGAAIQILYGGSVSPGNADELFGQQDVDGGLVGGASLDADSFTSIVQKAASRAAL